MRSREKGIIMHHPGLLFSIVALLVWIGCGSEDAVSPSLQGPIPHRHEHDFSGSTDHRATPDQLIIVLLEHPAETAVHPRDSGPAGTDLIPLVFAHTSEHLFALDHREGDQFSAVLKSAAGQEVLRVDATHPRVPQIIDAGHYTLEIHHGWGLDDAYLLFVRPGASSSTLSRDCPSCDLRGADLAGANLRKADLQRALLDQADLSDSFLAGADLRDADLGKADLQRALLNQADLSRADLTGADLKAARLRETSLQEADLSGADLDQADLTGADLSGATWTDGRTRCAAGSIGACQ